ncbi:MAG: ribbon-helix-helix protein, CopG family [Cyanobacteria bacterium]|nr:ribbon-helix-helix protein, CopG family [Cyanobacteriota bacterium]
MVRTTVYLPRKLKAAVKRTAAAAGISEAALIRTALQRATERSIARPALPLFTSGVPGLAQRVEEALAGDGGAAFGER